MEDIILMLHGKKWCKNGGDGGTQVLVWCNNYKLKMPMSEKRVVLMVGIWCNYGGTLVTRMLYLIYHDHRKKIALTGSFLSVRARKFEV